MEQRTQIGLLYVLILVCFVMSFNVHKCMCGRPMELYTENGRLFINKNHEEETELVSSSNRPAIEDGCDLTESCNPRRFLSDYELTPSANNNTNDDESPLHGTASPADR